MDPQQLCTLTRQGFAQRHIPLAHRHSARVEPPYQQQISKIVQLIIIDY